MNPPTIATAFDKWVADHHGDIVSSGLKVDVAIDLCRISFHGGYLDGFDHAKKSALSTLATALDPRPRYD